MNMLIGVLVEVVGVVSDVEKEKLQVGFAKDRLQHMLAEFGTDEDGDGLLSYNEFLRLLENPLAVRALQDVGVDAIGLVDFVDVIFSTTDRLTFGQVMEMVLSLRGSN